MKQEMISYLHTIQNDIYSIAKFLYENPEESYHEYKAYNYLCDIFRKNNFRLSEKYIDIPTAFYAEYGSGHPKICFLCLYDALIPQGHLSGHNLVSAISTAAALSLSSIIDKIGGTVIVIGSPGEYVGGAMVTMAKQETFKDMDVVMMVHPDIITAESGASNAILPLSIKFTGSTGFTYLKSDSFSPMDASLFVLNGINMLLKGYDKQVQIDSIINSGGYTPSLPGNVCEIKLYIRSINTKMAENVEEKIRKLADTAGSMMNIKHECSIYELPYKEMKTNKALSRIFSHNLKEIGVIDSIGVKDTEAGLSIGTISHYVPSIQPFISITEKRDIKVGTEDFAKETISEYALNQVIYAASALSLTALDIIQKENILSEIKSEFYK